MLDLAGKTLGAYQILDHIGPAGAGRVYRARHGTTGRYVAVKVFAPGALNDAAGQERFREKAATLAGLQHPNIVAVTDYGTTDDLYYLVMDYIDGPDLRRMLQERRGGGPPLDAPHIAQVINAVGSALDYAHRQGVLHLDIKPANILRGPGGQIYLTDFGSTRLVASGHVPDGNGTSGAAAYLSPEQAGGTRVDTRADLYSLGVVLHEMLTGSVPTASGTAPALPPGFAAIVQKALAPAPAARYQTAAELVEAVQQAIPTGTPAPVVAEDDFRVVAQGTDSATREMIVCPKCHGLNPPGSRFCDQCASPLPDPWSAAVSKPAPPPPPVPLPTPPPTLRSPEGPAVSLPVVPPGPPDPAPPAHLANTALSAPVSALPEPAGPILASAPPPVAPAPPTTPIPVLTTAGDTARPAASPATPAKRRDPVLLMIGGAIVALVLFLAVTAAALVFSNSSKPTPTPGTQPTVNEQATQLAQEAEQLHATQTALVSSDNSPAVRATAAAQGTATMAAIQATGTALVQAAAAATQTAASAPSPTVAANAPATAAAAQTEAAQGQATATAQAQVAAQATGTAQVLAQVSVPSPTIPPPPPPSPTHPVPPPSPTRPAPPPTSAPNTQGTAVAQATTAARHDATAQAAQAAQTSAARSGTTATAQALARSHAQATAAAQAAAQAAANAQATANAQSNANAQATANAQAAAAQAAAAQATAYAQATINAQKEAAAQQAAVNAQNTRIALTAAAQNENAQETQIANQFRAGQTATAAAAAARPTTPPNPCANVPASQSGSISPTCGRTGTVFQISINGFVPNEPISFWLTAPDGRVVGTSSPLDVGSHAASLTDEFDSSALTGTSYDQAGNWAITYQGATSGHQSIVRFKIIR